MQSKTNRRRLFIPAGVFMLGLAVCCWLIKEKSVDRIGEKPAISTNRVLITISSNQLPAFAAAIYAREATPLPGFRLRPFAVMQESTNYQWTAQDGKSVAGIRALAHNEPEFQRMAEENSRIFRRQLVYDKQPFSLAAQRAVYFGEPLNQLILPGLDGKEFSVDVSQTEFEAGGDRGTIVGKVAGRSDSMVVVAFAGGREGFTVISPQDNLYLHAEPREPGEIIVKAIDPNSYTGALKDCVVTTQPNSPK